MGSTREMHKQYERRLVIWLGITYVLIAIVCAALVIYAAVGAGWRPRRN